MNILLTNEFYTQAESEAKLKALSVIRDTLLNVEKTSGEKINIDEVVLDDPKTFELLKKGKTLGIFHLSDAGMRDFLTRLEPEKFEDIIAALALYRPGPMASGMVEEFLKRKCGLAPVEFDHPALKPILSDTYGVVLYQEQVSRIANKGFDLATPFGRDNLMNKAHAAAYAMIVYQTAYLKANYPKEFMAALLSSEMDNRDKLSVYIDECKSFGIKVLPPDINDSEGRFTVTGNNIRFGLAAEKNVLRVYLSSHLLNRYEKLIKSYSTTSSVGLYELSDETNVGMGGIIASVECIITRKGSRMAYIHLRDMEGTTRIVFFPKAYGEYAELLREDVVVYVKGKVDFHQSVPKVSAKEIIPISEIAQ